VPPPGAAKAAGKKVALKPAGNPETDGVTVDENPPETELDTAAFAVPPGATERVAGATEAARSAAVPATVKAKEAV